MSPEKRKTLIQKKRIEEKLERELGQMQRPSLRRRVSSSRRSSGVERRVRAVLIPVEPSQQFVRELGRGLSTAAAHSRQSLVRRYRTAIVVGVAVFGSFASMVGVVALIVRQRSRMRTGLSN
jgi:hypothetical protein